MPEFAVYFTFVLGFIALILAVVVGIVLITGSYYTVQWGRHWFETNTKRRFGQPSRRKKATVIVLPISAKAPWAATRISEIAY